MHYGNNPISDVPATSRAPFSGSEKRARDRCEDRHWLGAIIVLIVIGFIIVGVMFGGKMKDFVEDAQKNPTRATATMMVSMMVSMSGGKMQLVAEDDVNNRYTVKVTATGALTTVYWDEKKQAPEVIKGDFSAIPTETAPFPEVTPEAETE